MSLSEFGYQASSAAVTNSFIGAALAERSRGFVSAGLGVPPKSVVFGGGAQPDCSLVHYQLVTGTRSGLQKLRRGGINFDLLPQAVH